MRGSRQRDDAPTKLAADTVETALTDLDQKQTRAGREPISTKGLWLPNEFIGRPIGLIVPTLDEFSATFAFGATGVGERCARVGELINRAARAGKFTGWCGLDAIGHPIIMPVFARGC